MADGGCLSVYLESMSLEQHRESVRGLAPDEELKAPSVYVSVCVCLSIWAVQWWDSGVQGLEAVLIIWPLSLEVVMSINTF